MGYNTVMTPDEARALRDYRVMALLAAVVACALAAVLAAGPIIWALVDGDRRAHLLGGSHRVDATVLDRAPGDRCFPSRSVGHRYTVEWDDGAGARRGSVNRCGGRVESGESVSVWVVDGWVTAQSPWRPVGVAGFLALLLGAPAAVVLLWASTVGRRVRRVVDGAAPAWVGDVVHGPDGTLPRGRVLWPSPNLRALELPPGRLWASDAVRGRPSGIALHVSPLGARTWVDLALPRSPKT